MNYILRRGVIAMLIACLLVAFMPSVFVDGQVMAAGKKPGKVKSVTITQTKQTVTVKWKKASRAKKYQVKIQLKKGKKWKKFKTLNTKALSTAFKGTVGTTYRLEVRGIAGSKHGKWSKWKTITVKAAPAPVAPYDLEYWAKNSVNAASLRAYVKDVTNPKSKNFVPEADRIATFDMDGTFLGELYPTYFDTCLFMYRVLDDPNYKDKAREDLKKMAQDIRDTGTINCGMAELAQGFAESYAGMPLDEFKAYVKAFARHEPEGFDNLTYDTSFYKPMVSVMRYLTANHFKVYVVTGTERLTARALLEDTLGGLIPPERVIGSDFTMVASGQGTIDGLDYTLSKEDGLIMGDELIVKNLKMNKVTAIQREIGKQPILAFGNSSTDFAMAQYALNNKKYKGQAYMLLCDDTGRDYGNTDKAADFRKSCEKAGFHPVSMKNEFTTIYGEKVKLNPAKRRGTKALKAA
jgi:phosphoglycolate phosphatase-like HAD superfamily hydrolase